MFCTMSIGGFSAGVMLLTLLIDMPSVSSRLGKVSRNATVVVSRGSGGVITANWSSSEGDDGEMSRTRGGGVRNVSESERFSGSHASHARGWK